MQNFILSPSSTTAARDPYHAGSAPNTSTQTTSVSSERDAARRTAYVVANPTDSEGKKHAIDLTILERRAMGNGNRGHIVVLLKEVDADKTCDLTLHDILKAMVARRDPTLDLSQSQVRLETPESIEALSGFIKLCPMDATLCLPTLPDDKPTCRTFAEAMQQRNSHFQLKVVFSHSPAGGEFVLAKWTFKDLLGQANQPT
jgi:hypothetical protein